MRILAAIVIAGLLAAILAACGSDAPAATDTPVPPTAIAAPTQAPTSPPDTPTPAPTATVAPTLAPGSTPPPVPPVPTATPAPTAVPTTAPELTSTPEPSPTPVPEDTPTPEPTATPEPTSTPTPTPEPDLPPIAVTLAALGDNLVWVAHYDNSTQSWLVYDRSGAFSPDELPLPPGGSVPEPSAIASLTEIAAGKIYWIMASQEQTVQLGSQNVNIMSGLNFLSWR